MKTTSLFCLLLSGLFFLAACKNGQVRDFRGNLEDIPSSETLESKIKAAVAQSQINQNAQSSASEEGTDGTGGTDGTRPQTSDEGADEEQLFLQAEKGDSARKIAERYDLDPEAFATYNNVSVDEALAEGALLISPPRSATQSAQETQSIARIASTALNQSKKKADTSPEKDVSNAPLTHRVQEGETARSIAKAYKVSLKSLAEWNGLGSHLGIRVGQWLLIPTGESIEEAVVSVPLRIKRPTRRTQIPIPRPVIAIVPKDASDDENTDRLHRPAQGFIKTRFRKNVSDGLDIGVTLGAAVYAVDEGEITNITRDTQGVGIIVISHADDLLSIYEYVDDIQVQEGARVRKGQQIASILSPEPGHLHFELRRGFTPIDPEPLF